MKYLFILSLMITFGCQQSSDKEVTSGKSPSPYTVEPCYCAKIFSPVCAGGKNFGNSCEAECQGHSQWTDGQCQE